MMNWHNNWGWGNWLGMSLVMLLVIGVGLWLVVTLVQRSAKPETSARRAEDALAERFAGGEIDEVEYRGRLAALHDAERS
jgi:putative membrane protein